MGVRSLTTLYNSTTGSVVKQISCNVSVVKDDSSSVCDYCLAFLEKRQRCSKCRLIFYCSRSCQCSDWKWHQHECGFLHQHNKRVPGFIRLLARCSLLCHLEKTSNEDSFNFNSLFNDYETINEKEKLKYVEVMALLKNFLGEKLMGAFFDSTFSWMKLINQVIRNTITICSEELDELGYGLYYEASTVNHSCEPNAVFTFKGTNLTIRAIEDISEGQEVLVSYTDQLALKSERQKVLSEQFNFICSCIECVQQTREKLFESWKCQQSDCRGYFSTLQKTCTLCQNDQFNHREPSFQVSDLQSVSMETLKTYLKENEPRFPDFNLRMHKLLTQLSSSLTNLSQYEDCLPIELRIMENYRRYFEGVHPLKSLQLARVAKLYSFVGDLKLSVRYFEEALRNVLMTHGEDSNLYGSLMQQYNVDRLDASAISPELNPKTLSLMN